MSTIKACAISFLLVLTSYGQASAQTVENIQATANRFFSTYTVDGYRPNGSMRADSIRVDQNDQIVSIYTNEAFASQPFTPQSVNRIYQGLQHMLPAPYNTYHLCVYSHKGIPVEDLVPNILREGQADASRLWGKTDYNGQPWVTNTSLPYSVSRGLQGRHLFIWPSHGRYYKGGGWQWQRPYLFCTTEDLFTQSFVYPFLFPMLEKAGAVVYSPRERDIQTAEALVDNDDPQRQGSYAEGSAEDAVWSSSAEGKGFRASQGLLNDSTLPFTAGTYRMVAAVNRRTQISSAVWNPRIPRSGNYAVYVSYASRPNSVTDAHYAIYHKGGRTNVVVNQQMGGGTWVYVGTYEFDEGQNANGRVVLTNQSNSRGVITADAVRFGGGVGQTERGLAGTSGLPRFLEAARYQAQWCGLPDSLFNTEQGANDYNDDLRVRSNLLNYLGGGSPYMPHNSGQQVPFELAMALHSDAGLRYDRSVYGSLAICTTQDGEGNLNYQSGLSRQSSHDLAGMLLDNLTSDLTAELGRSWTRRELWDRNYAETRMPQVPSAILEMLSHQNFEDMKYGHDPYFKFALARSVYKTVLRFVNFEHGVKDVVVQPLPIHAFSATLSADGSQVHLKWKPTIDKRESTAQPTSYILYTKVDDEAFDNGLNIGFTTDYALTISPDKRYSFCITAVNAGGESFPSETLSVMHASKGRGTVLIVNGFNRLSGPARVETSDSIGFCLEKDMGVPYLYTTALAGAQRNFSPSAAGHDGAASLGYCGQEMMGKKLVGNTFDYPVEHGQAIAACGEFSFCSMSREAFEDSSTPISSYVAIDYIAGEEADMPYNLRPARCLTDAVRERLIHYLKEDHGALLLSGCYVGMDNWKDRAGRDFLEDVLKVSYDGTSLDTSETTVGLNLKFDIYRQPNALHYAAQHPDALLPEGKQAFPAFAYANGQGAGVAYKGRSYRCVTMGFPFECIKEQKTRNVAMHALLTFLTK